MIIGHLVFSPDSLTYTVARAFTEAGHDVFVWVTDPAYGSAPLSNIKRRLVETPRVALVAREEERWPGAIDRLIVQVFPRPVDCLRAIEPLAGRARRITLVTAGDRSRSWRQAMKMQWQEARAIGRDFGKVDRVAYKDGFYARDLHGLTKSRRVVGFDVHSQFLHSVDAFLAIHRRDWRPGEPRPILASFLGSQDPECRKRILDAVRELFVAGDQARTREPGAKSMYWHEYSDAAQAPLEPHAFLDVLTRSDFSLCPPGYSLVTHRPLEALLRGSIPVLPSEHLDLYDIGLEDGVNCIGVPSGRWRETVARLAFLGEESIVRMRNRIHDMLARLVDYGASSERMRGRLGAQPSGLR